MSAKNLIPSIKNPDVSSGGVSARNFTKQWNREPFNLTIITTGTEDNPLWLLQWEQNILGGLFFHSLSLFPQEEIFDEEALKARIRGHVLVDLLPDRAMLELDESLRSMLEFYSVPLALPLPSATKELPASIGEKFIRPEFHITGE